MGLLPWGSPRKVLREQGAWARFPHQSVLVWHQRSSVPLETCVWGGSEAEVLDSGTQCWLWSCGEVAGKWVARAWGSDTGVGWLGTLHVLRARRLQALVMRGDTFQSCFACPCVHFISSPHHKAASRRASRQPHFLTSTLRLLGFAVWRTKSASHLGLRPEEGQPRA